MTKKEKSEDYQKYIFDLVPLTGFMQVLFLFDYKSFYFMDEERCKEIMGILVLKTMSISFRFCFFFALKILMLEFSF